MNLADLTLKTTTFEVRYPPTYRLWDRSGEIWHRAAEKWPDLVATETSPNVTKFTWKRELELGLYINRLFVISTNTKTNSDAFVDFAKFLLDSVVPVFGIETFTRIGYRPIWARRFEKQEEAATLFTSCAILKLPAPGKFFGFEGLSKLPQISYRFEGEKLGATIQLGIKGVKLNVSPPFAETEIEPIDIEKFELIFDCDYYTMADTTIGQFRFDDWVKNALHVIRRDSTAILGG